MKIERIEEIIKSAGNNPAANVKLTIEFDNPPVKRAGQIVMLDGVPGDLLYFIEPNKYTALVKVKSLKSYVRKQKEAIND